LVAEGHPVILLSPLKVLVTETDRVSVFSLVKLLVPEGDLVRLLSALNVLVTETDPVTVF
jgi:hypothetical protein